MKKVFKKAHEITKSIIRKGDSYRETFRLALIFVYSEIKKGANKMIRKVEDILLDNGYKVWEKYGNKRIYLNDFIELSEKFGVTLENPKAYKGVTMYYDLLTNSFFTNGVTSSRKETVNKVINAIKNN